MNQTPFCDTGSSINGLLCYCLNCSISIKAPKQLISYTTTFTYDIILYDDAVVAVINFIIIIFRLLFFLLSNIILLSSFQYIPLLRACYQYSGLLLWLLLLLLLSLLFVPFTQFSD